jgi:UDP-N-acetylglucosamine 2-epimerase (non-hydrolysing)
MKIAPLWHVLKDQPQFSCSIVHTGQHYDKNMSDNFFSDLQLPQPHIFLGIGSGSHAEQTGKTMIAYEQVCLQSRPDLTIVVGDVNATVACALVCAKLQIPLIHLEAGLRSFDRSMPEEINRIVTDSISDLLLTPSADADQNLLKEGIDPAKIKLVGNIMIDTLELLRPLILQQPAVIDPILEDYLLLTLHRPSNVDSKSILSNIVDKIVSIAKNTNIIFPLHPRTKKQLEDFNLLSKLESSSNIKILPPLSYLQFMSLVFNSKAVITDSGGIQEETSYLGIPCLTLRENTERPITISLGTNQLVTADNLESKLEEVLKAGKISVGSIPFWDAKTSERILDVLKQYFSF